MKNDEKANALFDVFGTIDDDIVKEAEDLSTVRQERRTKRNRRFIAVLSAAAVVVMVAVPVSYFFLGLPANDAPLYTSERNLYSVMDRVKDVALSPGVDGITVYEYRDIDFFDGRCKIIWQYENGGTYYSVDAQGGEKVVNAKLSFPLTKKYSDGENLPYRVWISYGDGTVKSPYLIDSPGNTGFGFVFEYNPEIEPSGQFLNYFSALIGEKM